MRVLADRYGRVATDLRVSLTDRCNLRCDYCMPAEGLDWLGRDELLTDDETVRLIDIGVRLLGIRTVRLTGGEPLLRKGLEGLVAAIAELSPRPAIAMTTNGIGLDRRAWPLHRAGLDRLNVSMDTLDEATFAKITRRRRLPDVLAGIQAARDAGLSPVKINAVLIRGVNDHEAPDLLAWAMRERVQLRFIEQMPLDAQHGWRRTEMVTAEEILTRLSERYELVEDPAETLRRGSAPPRPSGSPGPSTPSASSPPSPGPSAGPATGSGSPPTGSCGTVSLLGKSLICGRRLRTGWSDEDIADRWVAALAVKRPGHGIDDPTFLQPDRPMSAIGG